MADMTLEQVANELRITARHGASLAPQTCHYLADAIDAAIKRHEQDAKDAARYRWLRNVADCDMEQPYVVITREGDWGKSYDRLLDGLYLDAAIDAAMAKEAGR